MAGFALAAPLLALLLVMVVGLAGALWQREVAASVLARSVATAAAHGGSLSEAEVQFWSQIGDSGLSAKDVRWHVINVNGVAVLEGVAVVSVGGGLLPVLDSTLTSRSAVG